MRATLSPSMDRARYVIPGYEPEFSGPLARRTPTWREMEWVRDQFWEPEELVVQFSVPRSQHISYHDYTLHMWKPIGVELPLPPSITVAPTP